MKLLDLFCGAGGAAMGYHRAGFDEIVGVDNRPMPRYPFTFVQADALEYVREHGHEFDAIHASPPCEGYSPLRALRPDRQYVDLIPPLRDALQEIGVPWVIENVATAPLLSYPALDGRWGILLCGTMFGLSIREGELRRHRLFESSIPLTQPPCHHRRPAVTVTTKRHAGRHFRIRNPETIESARQIMGIDWATRHEIGKAVPPAYTEFIGRQVLQEIRNGQHSLAPTSS